MILYTHPRSPFARKVMMFAQIHKIALDYEVVDRLDPKHGYTDGHNPLGKIPALEWHAGQFLFDSPVICEHLDALSKTPLLPKDKQAAFEQKWWHALADGLAEANMNLMFERLRPENHHWPEIIERYETAIADTIRFIEGRVDDLSPDWTYGNIGLVAALDFITHRACEYEWRRYAPKLANWHFGFVDTPVYQDNFGYWEEL
ncbi:MAG: glutathione S-transferase family protein [Maricaulaceae bacterium]